MNTPLFKKRKHNQIKAGLFNNSYLGIQLQRSKSDLGWTCSIDLFSLAWKISAAVIQGSLKYSAINISLLSVDYQEFSGMLKFIEKIMCL